MTPGGAVWVVELLLVLLGYLSRLNPDGAFGVTRRISFGCGTGERSAGKLDSLSPTHANVSLILPVARQ